MNKRLLDLIFKDYIDEVENHVGENFQSSRLSKENREKILKMFSQPIKLPEAASEEKIEVGNVYLMFKDDIPIYYVVLSQVDDKYYEVLKMSNYYELANQNDLITELNNNTFAVETWNKFYMRKDEIKKSILYGKLDNKDFELLTKFVKGKINNLPEGKRGLTVPVGNSNFYQNRFHAKESEIVREYKLRLFEDILQETEPLVIEISPEREKNLKMELVAGKERKVFRNNNIIFKKNFDANVVEIIFPPEMINKKAKIKIFDKELKAERLPEKVYLKVSSLEDIDLAKLSRYVEVKVEPN